MFVKTLALKGFKSFAEPATLELEPGITVVVGPNGSGKSNVVDAVAWVLGAQGPRTLRSSKMEDVIFAGTGRRQALGRAEVSLTIDNASGRLPIEVAEVTITRTLWRSGESEYAINGTPCRLLDVQELLSDSGVGRQQHIIVGQGQLDAVLNARPEDRRLIVEEAAGVLKYRRRRERTERRLTATESDLSRLQDLLREVRRQMRPLERQAEAARRHDALVVEHRALRLHLAGQELADADAKVSAVTAERAELAEQAEGLGRRLAAVGEELEAAEAAVAANRVDDLNQTIGALEGLAERSRGLGAVLLERQRSVEASLAAAVDATVVASLESESATVAEELEEVESEAGEVATGLSDLLGEEQALAEERTRAEELQAQAGGEDAGSGSAREAPEGVSTAPELRG
ncbi:MAG TPA: AAA family ATPase, partial [Acidimicrobiales bacterium]|nr:AAA family ATPase [Acidimicrobiales bacterium]